MAPTILSPANRGRNIYLPPSLVSPTVLSLYIISPVNNIAAKKRIMKYEV
jgi:hypothetical protein